MRRRGKTQNDEPGWQKGEVSLVFELTGKRAVVTGAASGIGFAIAQLFASQGANVVLIDLDLERLNTAMAAIKEKTEALLSVFACDVGSEESVQKTFAEIAGPIDILVNCAGLAHVGTLQSTSLDDFERLFAVNVRGTYLCMRAAIKGYKHTWRTTLLMQ